MNHLVSGTRNIVGIALVFSMFLMVSCSRQPATLKEAYADDFLVGAAVNRWIYSERDTSQSALVKEQFNSITNENCLKWERVHPRPGEYNFDASDQYVQYGEDNGMVIVGHVLTWHSQTPDWVFEDADGEPLTREALLARMKEHIETLMTRYKGRIGYWDVVNEALADDGSMRKNKWYRIIGEDWVARAFEFAHATDPEAGLIYNDYSLSNPAKRDGAVRLIKSLQEQGLKVDGIGMQCHYHMHTPALKDLEESIIAFGGLGLQVHVTELDINVLPTPPRFYGANVNISTEMREELNPYPDSLPVAQQQALAGRYADFFTIFKEHSDKIARITFWGVSDRSSWLNNWPVRGRTNYPLLFDRQLQPKPAFYSVMEVAAD